MGRGKWIGIGAGVLLVFIIIVAVGASTSQSTLVSSQSGNSPFTIAVTKTISYKTTSEKTYYIYVVDVTNTDSTKHHFYPTSFQMVSNTNAVYTYDPIAATFFLNGQGLQSVQLNPNQHVKGNIAFSMPNNEAPSKIEYIDSLENINIFTTNLPEPSSWISSVSAFPEVTVSGDSELSVLAFALVKDASTTYYATGQTISIKISVSYYGLSGANPDSIKVTSITVSDPGFTLSSTTPSLPISVDRGDTNDIVVNVIAPASSHNGNLHFTVNVSG